MKGHSTTSKAFGLATLLIAGAVSQAQACRQGFVWREASGPNDIVCVTPVERSTAAIQNKNYPYETCSVGLVWREATSNDHRCVTPEERTAVADQNRKARDTD